MGRYLPHCILPSPIAIALDVCNGDTSAADEPHMKQMISEANVKSMGTIPHLVEAEQASDNA